MIHYPMMQGSTRDIFRRRRKSFAKAMKGGVAVLPGSREEESALPFRQNSDFYYLTGFDEPGAIAVIHPLSRDGALTLFVQPKDPDQERWTGPRMGPMRAKKEYGAMEAYPIGLWEERMLGLLKEGQSLYYGLGNDDETDGQILDIFQRMSRSKALGKKGLNVLIDPGEILSLLRWKKGGEEIDLLRKACGISSDGHRAVMNQTLPGMSEQQVAAILAERFYAANASRPAFPFIVASGANATILHYEKNTSTLRDGDLLLVDAGAEYQHYAGDVTRTFPVSSTFTPIQRELYEIVLLAQEQAIQAALPGEPLFVIHEVACRLITQGLKKMGLLRGRTDRILRDKEYLQFYPHNTSHWVGLDVHDRGPGTTQQSSPPLQTGLVLTVEPGIYIGKNLSKVPKEFRGIGIRIEDVVLVTRKGPQLLTQVPKATHEIETIRSKALSSRQ